MHIYNMKYPTIRTKLYDFHKTNMSKPIKQQNTIQSQSKTIKEEQ